MPGTLSEPPSVSLSFANNFWGKDDAGVSPLLERMYNAKNTGDELKAFYSARATIEDEYARKLLSLSRKALGAGEAGTLRMSLDVVKAEVESMGKQHQNIAQQMKTELDESLSAFAGGMKERRKIVQNSIEKLLKTKMAQTIAVNKARDRYEQDCLKIKGYLAQGHMVMGQEERKNKAKLEKTQIQMSTTSSEYEQAVKVLEETTGRWNRDWKAACDKFQDLEEERIDFMKSSLWSFANIASTVCVSDDASCEKIRLSLEDCDVEKDISSFIRECGTGQEIPDPPKFINFCKEDITDTFSEISGDENYSVAQFSRTVNPAFRSATPQPGLVESFDDQQQDAAAGASPSQHDYMSRPTSTTPRKPVPVAARAPEAIPANRAQQFQQTIDRKDFAMVPHNEYPLDGMTQFCRIGPPSATSSVVSPVRPLSRESQSHSEYSQGTSLTESSLLSISPTKQFSELSAVSGPPEESSPKKRSIFESRSPFRRKSTKEKDHPQRSMVNSTTPQRAGNVPPSGTNMLNSSPSRQGNYPEQQYNSLQLRDRPASPSPEPVDPRTQFQLNVGNNVFDVASPDAAMHQASRLTNVHRENDPIAQALAELKNVTKQPTVRQSADRYHGLATPGLDTAQTATPTNSRMQQTDRSAAQLGTPPPVYETSSASRLGAPQPAFTSRAMQQTTQKYVEQKQNVFGSPSRPSYDQPQPSSQRSTPQARPGAQGSQGYNNRATSPAPFRSTSPRPSLYDDARSQPNRSVSPNPYNATEAQSMLSRPRAQSSPRKQVPNGGSWRGAYNDNANPPSQMQQPAQQQQQHQYTRSASPQPQQQFNRSPSGRHSDSTALQLAPAPQQRLGYNNLHARQSQPQLRGRSGTTTGQRPVSQYGNPNNPNTTTPQQQQQQGQQRSRSTAPDSRSQSQQGGPGQGQQQYARDGRPILHFARAVYLYNAAIPEELSFGKGEVLAVLRHQDDGWWEAEIKGRRGLAPSNYLVPC